MKKFGASLLITCSFHAMAEDAPAQACQQALRSGNFDKAIESAQQAIRQSHAERDVFLCLGRAQGLAGDHVAAVASLREADRNSRMPIEHMQALSLLGNEHQAAGAYVDARIAYGQSLELARKERNAYFQRANLLGIGETLQAEGDLQGALDHYQQGAKLAANDNERADCHEHLAALYHAQGNHDQAITQQIKAVVMEERSGDLDHYAGANLDLGLYYLDAGQLPNAERTLSKLLTAVTQAGDPYWEARIYQLQARLKRAQNKPEEGSQLLQRALDLANRIGAGELAKEIELSRRE